MSKSKSPNSTAATGAAPIEHFFSVVLPHLVVQSIIEFIEHEGTLCFDVHGVGQWSFTFGVEEPIKRGVPEKADLALTFTRGSFEAFIGGSLDVPAAVKAKEITSVGTGFSVLESFARLLRPPSRNLGWDVHGTR
jgi:hypothetical protein